MNLTLNTDMPKYLISWYEWKICSAEIEAPTAEEAERIIGDDMEPEDTHIRIKDGQRSEVNADPA